MESFGASAPEKVLAEQFGLTPPQVARRVAEFMGR